MSIQFESKTSNGAPIDSFLEGFETVASDSAPHVTLDNQRRIYLNTSARRLIDVKPYDRLSLAYNPTDKSIAIIKTPQSRLFDLSTSVFNVDKRFYLSARHFADKYGYTSHNAPYVFAFDRASSDGSVIIFRLKSRQ